MIHTTAWADQIPTLNRRLKDYREGKSDYYLNEEGELILRRVQLAKNVEKAYTAYSDLARFYTRNP